MTKLEAQSVRWKGVIVDLDGTLLDTRPGIRAALAGALADVTGSAELPAEPDWSLPLGGMVESLLPYCASTERDAVVASFRRRYDGGIWSQATPFPGAAASLSALRASGIRVFIVTNKRDTAARLLLAEFGLDRYVDAVVAQPDTGEALPKAALAKRCLHEAGLAADVVAVVGDSDHDQDMAAAWAMPFIAVTTGTGPLSSGPTLRSRVEVGSLIDAVAYLLENTPGSAS